MPKAGDKFTVTLRNNHIGWGTVRKTNTRGRVKGESYLPIPIVYARKFSITNLHEKVRSNIYTFSTKDGFYTNQELKASGCRKKGDKLAKNLHGNNNLKLLTPWYTHIGAKKGTQITIEFLSPTEILLYV